MNKTITKKRNIFFVLFSAAVTVLIGWPIELTFKELFASGATFIWLLSMLYLGIIPWPYENAYYLFFTVLTFSAFSLMAFFAGQDTVNTLICGGIGVVFAILIVYLIRREITNN